jgi:hypothetical protein
LAQTVTYLATHGSWDVRAAETDTGRICFARSIDAAASNRDVYWVVDPASLADFPDGQFVADPRLLPIGGEAAAVIDEAERFSLIQGVDGFLRSDAETAPDLFAALREGLDLAIIARGPDAVRQLDISLVGFTGATTRALEACAIR